MSSKTEAKKLAELLRLEKQLEATRAAALKRGALEDKADAAELERRHINAWRCLMSKEGFRALELQGFDRLLFDAEVDSRLRWPRGMAKKMADSGKLKSIILPDGSIRFRSSDIAALIALDA